MEKGKEEGHGGRRDKERRERGAEGKEGVKGRKEEQGKKSGKVDCVPYGFTRALLTP